MFNVYYVGDSQVRQDDEEILEQIGCSCNPRSADNPASTGAIFFLFRCPVSIRGLGSIFVAGFGKNRHKAVVESIVANMAMQQNKNCSLVTDDNYILIGHTP